MTTVLPPSSPDEPTPTAPDGTGRVAPSPGSPPGGPETGPETAPQHDQPTAPQHDQPTAPPSVLSTTRAAAAWFATAAALLVLVLLIILILQNQKDVEVRYLGLSGTLPLGTALLIAAVAGGAVVTIVGVIRLTQLRVHARRARRLEAGHGSPKTGSGSPKTGRGGTKTGRGKGR